MSQRKKETKPASASKDAPKKKDSTAQADSASTREDAPSAEQKDAAPSAGQILVAFEKLFGGGRGVARFSHSGLRHVKLGGGAVLVEQNPRKSSEWAQLAREGRRIAWLLHDGEYLARVVDGEVTMLD